MLTAESQINYQQDHLPCSGYSSYLSPGVICLRHYKPRIYQAIMDPISIIGVTAAIQQLLNCIFKYSQGVREAKTEINALCSELLGLRAALSHVHFIVGLDDKSDEITQDVKASLSSTMFDTPEFHEMLLSTKTILQELLSQLEIKHDLFRSSMQRLRWPLIKGDVKKYVERLERCKSWIVLVTTSDNL